MPKKKKTRKVVKVKAKPQKKVNLKIKKVKKPRTPKVKKPRGRKPKAIKIKEVKIPINQIENINQWLAHYKEHKKLPHNRIVCTHCKNEFVSLKGIAMSHAMKAFDNDITMILTKSVCKPCKAVLFPKEEKAERVVHIETPEEREARYDKIRATIPKIDLHRVREIIDLRKDKDACKQHTYFACHSPQIYLDYGCNECSLQKHCACPIKDVGRVADGRGKKKKK